jgi:anthraniloyl-CoA monooxygenase
MAGWYQVPFAEDPVRGRRARHGGGANLDWDHANTVVAAGRADLCALARPHLAIPT